MVSLGLWGCADPAPGAGPASPPAAPPPTSPPVISAPASPPAISTTSDDGHVSLRARFVYVVVEDDVKPDSPGNGFCQIMGLPANYDRRRVYELILARHPRARIYHTATFDVKSASAQWAGNLMQSTATGPVDTGVPMKAEIKRWSRSSAGPEVSAYFSVSSITLPQLDDPAPGVMSELFIASVDPGIATNLVFSGAPAATGGLVRISGERRYSIFNFAEVVPVNSGRVIAPMCRRAEYTYTREGVPREKPLPQTSPAAVDAAQVPASSELWLQYERYYQLGLTLEQAQAVVAAARLPGEGWRSGLQATAHNQAPTRFYTGPMGLTGSRRNTVVFNTVEWPDYLDIAYTAAEATPVVSITPWVNWQTPPDRDAEPVPMEVGDAVVVITQAKVFAEVFSVKPTEMPGVYRDDQTGFYAVHLVRVSRVAPPGADV